MKADDIVGDIIEYESGDMTQERAVEFFQKLIDSGLAWKLQGSYGRFAVTLIEAGLCHLPGKVKCVRGS
jgi:hypothetical protein